MHQSTPLWRNWILVCLTLLFGPAANRITAAADSAGVTFVNAAHIGGRQSGTSWATAYSSLQSAISSGTTTIWVARGVYSPGNRHRDTFQLRPGLKLYGGFVGTETRLSQRNWVVNKTILEGNGAYHVVTGATGAVLDGFIVTGGNAVPTVLKGNGGRDARDPRILFEYTNWWRLWGLLRQFMAAPSHTLTSSFRPVNSYRHRPGPQHSCFEMYS